MNFNPAGAPYLGEWDVDTDDECPNEVRSLIHITGELKLQDDARLYRAVICEDDVVCEG